MDPFENLPVGLDHTAEILAETVFVQNSLLGVTADVAIPEPAGVGTDLVGHHQLTVRGEAQLDLEVHQLQGDLGEETPEGRVHGHGQALQLLALRRGQHTQTLQARVGQQRIAVGVVLVIEIEQGGIQRGAGLDRHLLAEGAKGDIPHHHLHRNDLNRLHQHPVGFLQGEVVGRNPLALEQLKQPRGDLTVHQPLARQLGLLQGVKGGGVVLVFDRHQIGLIGLIDALGLAFVEERSEGVSGHGCGAAWPPGSRGERSCCCNASALALCSESSRVMAHAL